MAELELEKTEDLVHSMVAARLNGYTNGYGSKVQSVKKNASIGFCLISRQPSIGFLNRFFPLKTEIHAQIE